LEDLLEPLDRARALVDLCLAQPGQIAQPSDFRRRHEAGPDQSVLHELADPFGVFDVGLAAGDVAQLLGVEQPALKPLLERLEDRLSVHAGRLHPDERDRGGGQPFGEVGQPRKRRPERPRLLIRSPATLAGDTDGRHDIVAMHVKTRAPLHHHIHLLLPSDDG
jgi:hypothetical protein